MRAAYAHSSLAKDEKIQGSQRLENAFKYNQTTNNNPTAQTQALISSTQVIMLATY